ncbi:hypothetical protein [Gordonia sp. (in: high G+C Gram-positive bacteria)]|uniref:hypothetical protein n=1 Tax=Gordonia sp. (in: high G+C Gram-positive bacteria) TaxID=84139 RepID=UPI0026211B18|nr:hypothetical protein [Gordonia sp. (in: high G+C Gram-positive bacteria)]
MTDELRPATSTIVSPRAALRWSWTRFRETPAALAGAAALWLLVLAWVVVALLWAEDLLTGHLYHRALEAAAGGGDITSGNDYMAAMSTYLWFVDTAPYIEQLIFVIPSALLTSCAVHGLLVIADGRRPHLADFFRAVSFWPILLFSLAGTGLSIADELVVSKLLGLTWPYVAIEIIVALLAAWMPYAIADRRGAPVLAAVGDGLLLAVRHPGQTIVAGLLGIGLILAGLFLLGVGLLVALPLSGLVAIYYFRTLRGRPPT